MGEPPQVLGANCAGTVVEVGLDTKKLKSHDKVRWHASSQALSSSAVKLRAESYFRACMFPVHASL